jgi:hypothetical protein
MLIPCFVKIHEDRFEKYPLILNDFLDLKKIVFQQSLLFLCKFRCAFDRFEIFLPSFLIEELLVYVKAKGVIVEKSGKICLVFL